MGFSTRGIFSCVGFGVEVLCSNIGIACFTP
nr:MULTISPECIES: DUF3265 domain-containing protein [Vibrio]